MTPAAAEEPGQRSTPTQGRVIPSGVPLWQNHEHYVALVGEVILGRLDTPQTLSFTPVPVVVYGREARGEAHAMLDITTILYAASVLALAELERMHAYFYPKCEGVCSCHVALDALRAAVAKAEGRRPEMLPVIQPSPLPVALRLRDAAAVLAGMALAVRAIDCKSR